MSRAPLQKVVPADIRKKFHQRHTITPEEFKAFKSFPSNPTPLLITGRDDKQILAFRLCISTTFLTTLNATKHLLPPHAEKLGRRGDYKTRNYCLWADYAHHPYLSGDLLQDGKAATKWLTAQAPLFKYLSEVLKLVDFASYETITNHPWLDKLIVNKAPNLSQ